MNERSSIYPTEYWTSFEYISYSIICLKSQWIRFDSLSVSDKFDVSKKWVFTAMRHWVQNRFRIVSLGWLKNIKFIGVKLIITFKNQYKLYVSPTFPIFCCFLQYLALYFTSLASCYALLRMYSPRFHLCSFLPNALWLSETVSLFPPLCILNFNLLRNVLKVIQFTLYAIPFLSSSM